MVRRAQKYPRTGQIKIVCSYWAEHLHQMQGVLCKSFRGGFHKKKHLNREMAMCLGAIKWLERISSWGLLQALGNRIDTYTISDMRSQAGSVEKALLRSSSDRGILRDRQMERMGPVLRISKHTWPQDCVILIKCMMRMEVATCCCKMCYRGMRQLGEVQVPYQLPHRD